ncbi:unnamed protein product, partial [Urochloa humidicola]
HSRKQQPPPLHSSLSLQHDAGAADVRQRPEALHLRRHGGGAAGEGKSFDAGDSTWTFVMGGSSVWQESKRLRREKSKSRICMWCRANKKEKQSSKLLGICKSNVLVISFPEL